MHKPPGDSVAHRHGDFNLLYGSVVAEDDWCTDACGAPAGTDESVAPLDGKGHVGGGFVLGVDEVEAAAGSLTLDFRTTVNGGQWYTPVDENVSQFVGEQFLDDSKAYSIQYPAYFRIDFKIGFKHNGKKTTQQWSVDMRNLTNQQNVFIRKYDASTNSYSTSYQTGFLPVVQYRIEF